MAQTKTGAIKTAAKTRNIPVDAYNRLVESGLKWCSGCKRWHIITEFGKDRYRGDGLAAACKVYRKKIYYKTYIHKVRISKKGSRYSIPRDGDKKQARHRTNHLIALGILPNPNTLLCADCGKIGIKRNEYHHESYAAINQEIVVVLCTKCHAKRHMKTKTRGKKGD